MSDGASPVRLALQRTQIAEDDTAWLPLSMRAAGALVGGAAFAGVSALVIGFFVFLLLWGGVIWIGALSLGLIPITYQLRDTVARAIMRRRMSRFRRTAVQLRDATDRRDELIRVRGRLRAQTTIRSLLDDRPVVFRRLVFAMGGLQAVHECGVDVLLDDGSGDPVLVLLEGARFVDADVHPREYRPLPPSVLDALRALDPARQIAETLNDWRIDLTQRGLVRTATGAEQVLCDGDEVEVVGHRSRAVDQTMPSRLARDTPFRAALQGSSTMPLLIARVPR
jgi:hypothetical protein